MKQRLPSAWLETIIEDIFRTTGGGTPSTIRTEFWGDGVPWITSADIDDAGDISPRKAVTHSGIASSATIPVPPNSVIVVTRVGLGKVGLAKQELCFSQDCQALLFNPDLLDPSFVAHQTRCIVRGIRGRGTTIAGVTVKQLGALPFSLAPLPEQHRIADAIDSYMTRLDDAVASLERVRGKLKSYQGTLLKAAVEGRLVPTEAALARAEKRNYEPADALLARILKERRRRWEDDELAKLKDAGKTPKDDNWKTRYREPKAPDTSTLPELPNGWCWVTLPQLGELNRGKSKHRPRNDPRLLGGNYPFVQTGDVRKAETWLRTFKDTYSEFGLEQSRLWPAGTLCITIAANIAETAILGFDACFPDSVVGFRQDEPILTRYVELFLRTARQRLGQYAPATAQKNINLDTLSRVAVPLPPLNEQRRMVEEFDRLSSVGATIDDCVLADQHRCSRLRQAVLKWAFEGKLVDQDLNDEPAEKLLARIWADRATASATKNHPEDGCEELRDRSERSHRQETVELLPGSP